jgi:Ca-activated chloride channel family protein
MRTLFVSLCLLAGGIPIIAADDSGPRLPDTQTIAKAAPSIAAVRNPASIRIDVNVTLVPVTVMDSSGRNVMGLRQENFRVFDDNEQRPIISFGSSDAPISVGLIYDCSRSMTDKFAIARQAPAQLFQQLNPEDEAFLITVSDRPVLRQDFTSDFNDIQNALLFTHPNGTTSLIDGIYMGLQKLKQAHNPRKALIVVSDGGDNNSRYTLRDLSSLAAESDTEIFAICIYGNPQSEEEANGPGLLSRLSQSSGGISYVMGDVNAMKGTFGKIGVTLHHQYMLGYYPSTSAPSGKYRKIKVQLVLPQGIQRLRIFSRGGYYAP